MGTGRVDSISTTRESNTDLSLLGLVDNHGAESTNLSETDVKRLDSLCWRALKNQTTSRSKLGQEPRLYVRPEYKT